MTTSRPLPDPVRKALPWLAGWFGFHAVVALAGWITAWRRNEGDESSLGIRRTVTHNGLELRPTNPQLSRVRLDLAMAGAEIDLTAIPQPATGVDTGKTLELVRDFCAGYVADVRTAVVYEKPQSIVRCDDRRAGSPGH